MALFDTLREVLTPYAEKINEIPLYAPLTHKKRPSIPDNTDIDTILTPGEYKITTSTHAKTMTNLPSTLSGVLTVTTAVSSTTYFQTYRVVSTNSYTYVRTKIGANDSWSNWKLVNTDIDGDALVTTVTSMGETITRNTSRISILEDTSGVVGEYFTPYETEEEALYRKVNNDIDNNTLVFVISADNHYRETKPEGEHQVYHAEIMAKIAKRLRADAIINLGDIITQYIDSVDDPVYSGTRVTAEEVNTKRLAKMATAFQSTGIPFLYTLAHHEMCLHDNGPTSTDNTSETSVYPYPAEKVLGLCGKGSEWLEEHHYTRDRLSGGYYVDFDKQQVRIIFYDSVGYTACGFTPASIAFISEAFSSVPTGYKVLVCTHVASRYPGVYSAQVKNGDQVETIMQNFVSNGGVILAEMHGHSHFDNVVKLAGIPYPYIGICCAENSWSTVSEKIEAGVQGNPVSYKYHASKYGAIGTYNEWLFDVVCVHPDTNTIKLFRFGIGSDRTVTLS